MGSGPAVAPGGRGSTGPRVLLPGGRDGSGWSAGGEGLQAADRSGDLGGPGPGRGEAQPQAAATADQAPGGGEQAQPQPLGFPGPGGARRGRASAVQAVSSQAMATSSHQIWFWAKPCRGRLRSPVSLAHRIRSSQRARRRWRSSRSASCPVFASVAKQVTRCPPMSVNRSCAPGWLSRPAARCRCCHRSVSAGRSPNPACAFPRTGLSTVSAVRRGWPWSRDSGSCCRGAGIAVLAPGRG